jgi:DSF synthase
MNALVEFPTFATTQQYTQLSYEFDAELKTIFSWMKPAPRPCFNRTLVQEIGSAEALLESHQGWISDQGTPQRVDYVVFGSAVPGVYNLGGDLELFVQAILSRDRDTLSTYAHECVRNIYRRHTGFGANIGTISLVQGKALGGGFECALASDLIVAERSATLGLPEMLFNLFPGMGALSFLARRIGLRKAEEIITSPGEPYSAEALHDMGVVDYLVEDGRGVEFTRQLIRERQRRQTGYRALQAAKQQYQPVRLEELTAITDVWVNAAFEIDTRDLRMMQRLVRAQDRLASHKPHENVVELMPEPLRLVVNG